jgi:hypothetical protein
VYSTAEKLNHMQARSVYLANVRYISHLFAKGILGIWDVQDVITMLKKRVCRAILDVKRCWACGPLYVAAELASRDRVLLLERFETLAVGSSGFRLVAHACRRTGHGLDNCCLHFLVARMSSDVPSISALAFGPRYRCPIWACSR